MQYRTYKYVELPTGYYWEYPNADGSTGRYYNRDTLAYAAGGAVADYEVDNDYMVDNNSTVYIATETAAVAGQIIALIDGSTLFDLGVISRVDTENRKILYRSMQSLLDVELLNPTRGDRSSDDVNVTYLYDGVDDFGRIIASYFAAEGVDRYLRLPIFVRTSGGGKTNNKYNVPAIWDYTDNTVNLMEIANDLFDKHNVVLQFSLVFEVNRAYIEIFINHNTTEGRLIKNNVKGMTVTHAEEGGASATVCTVVDRETKAKLSTWYLLSSNTVTTNSAANNRLQPYKLTVAEFDADNEDGATEQTVAEEALLYKDFNHYINVEIDQTNALFPQGLSIGESVTLVPEIEEMQEGQPIESDYEDKIYRSIYTGRKASSKSTMVTLIFGKIRINYTDIMQMRLTSKVRG